MMTKLEIEGHAVWKYISGLSPAQRYGALFGSAKKDIEKNFGVTIEEHLFTDLSNTKDEEIIISCLNTDRNIMVLAVLKPINP